MNVTENEMKVLKSLRTNDFGDGEFGRWIWSDCINSSRQPSGIEGKPLSGTVASLVNKGLVETDGNTGRDATLRLTQSGWDLTSN